MLSSNRFVFAVGQNELASRRIAVDYVAALASLVAAIAIAAGAVAAESAAPAKEGGLPVFSFSKAWAKNDLRHQPEAQGMSLRGGFAYLGTYGSEGQIVKLRIKDGAVSWSQPTGNSYQPSYPASNGEVVVYGTYYDHQIVGRDDKTGKKLWSVPTGSQNMSSATFTDKLAVIGSYDNHLYGIRWATGEVAWKTRLESAIWSRPVALKKDVVVGCYNGNLYRIETASGEIVKTIDCGGRIECDPLVAGGLLIALIDDQKYGENYDGTKVRRTCLAIDVETNKIVSRIAGDRTLSKKLVVADGRVFFFSDESLYAYDLARRSLAWKFELPMQYRLAGTLPNPLVQGDTLLLPFNRHGKEGQHASHIITLSADKGQVIRSQSDGGLGFGPSTWFDQADGLVFTSDLGGSAAYRIVAKSADEAPKRGK